MNWAGLCKLKCIGGMGFHDLVAFNKALQEKQVWGIIQNPHSLMAQLLKCRYFKNLHTMEEGLGHNPYFVCLFILWSWDLI